MSLSFPNKSEQKNNDGFLAIVKEIHPLIDLENNQFDLKKEDKPVIEVKEEIIRPRNDFRKISHPKFKNVSLGTAIEEVKMLKIGEFIIRPSTEGADYLTITWQFYKNVIAHVKLKM